MADEPIIDPEQERQMAAAALQGQPGDTAVGYPLAPLQQANGAGAVRAADYAQRGLPTAGEQNAFGFTGANTVTAPPVGTPALGIGDYIDRSGNVLGQTHSEQGVPNPVPEGTVGVQGRVSQQEQDFWNAHPNGAVIHPDTGELIGLGDSEAVRQARLQSTGFAPTPQTGGVAAPPNFIHVQPPDPAVPARRQEIENAMADLQNQLRTASTRRPTRYQPSEAQSIQNHLDFLQRAWNGLSKTEVIQQHNYATGTEQNAKIATKYNSDAARVALATITAAPGSDEYRQQVFNIWHTYHDLDQDAQNKLQKASAYHDQRAQTLQLAQQQGLTTQITGIGKGGQPTVKFTDPNAVPDTQVQSRYAKLQAGIQGHLEKSAEEAKANASKKLVAEPYSKAAALHAQQLEAQMLETQHPGLLKVTAPTAQAAATEATAKPAQVRQGGVVYHLQPDGSYK